MHASNVLQALPAQKLLQFGIKILYASIHTESELFLIKRIYNQMGGDINEPWKKNKISLSIKMGDKNEATTFLNIKRLPFMNVRRN